MLTPHTNDMPVALGNYCADCTRELFGMMPGDNDFTRLCAPGKCIEVTCSGCGVIHVNHRGERLDFVSLASKYTGPSEVNA